MGSSHVFLCGLSILPQTRSNSTINVASSCSFSPLFFFELVKVDEKKSLYEIRTSALSTWRNHREENILFPMGETKEMSNTWIQLWRDWQTNTQKQLMMKFSIPTYLLLARTYSNEQFKVDLWPHIEQIRRLVQRSHPQDKRIKGRLDSLTTLTTSSMSSANYLGRWHQAAAFHHI